MNNKKKLMIIGIAITFVLVIGITYAWFNYTKVGKNGELVAGDIYLTMGETGNQVNLTNVFPETAEEARARNDNYMIFTLSGKNTSENDIYYEIKLVYGDDLASPKMRYTDSDLVFDLVELDSNNNEIKKVVDAKSFSSINDKKIWVDTIDHNTAEEITRKYMLRVWLNENVIISDTVANANYKATGDHAFKNYYGNVKVEVFGDFTEKEAPKYLYDIMKKNAVMDNIASEFVSASTGIDFGEVSSDTNGKGVYMRAGTENDTYPILYYRGAVEDNNVLFNNKCWKAVRTTDTGGVKLIYNGEQKQMQIASPLEQNEYTILNNTNNIFSYDSSDTNGWIAAIGNDGTYNFEVSVTPSSTYLLTMIASGNTSESSITFSMNDIEIGEIPTVSVNFNDLSSSEAGIDTVSKIKVIVNASNVSSSDPLIMYLRMSDSSNSSNVLGCGNTGEDTYINLSGTNTFAFNTNHNSPAYVGYMYGDVYTGNSEATTSGAYYGTGFTWDGTNYTLTNAKVGYDGTHHYTCNLTIAEGTCSSIRYYYYVSERIVYNYYITLTGGDSIEKAIEKMQTNTNPSNAKTQIDTWYAANMNTITSKLEDTIWCNDRSISSKAGWDPNGNVTENYLYYSPYDRSYNTNVPSLSCANKNDAFTVSNGDGNQKLTYPVALLTSDEIILAGGNGERGSAFYLSSGASYWSLSPSYFRVIDAYGFHVSDGYIYSSYVGSTFGLRPSVSLKPGTPVISGDGTVTSPYIIGS